MASSVLSLAAALRAALVAFDPAAVPGAACEALVESLAATENACAAARVRAAARAAATGVHRGAGFRDAASWLAAVSGSSPGAAKDALATAGALDSCPATLVAMASGELSLAQAKEITQAEADRPGSEAELVALAKRASLAALRDEARKRRFAAVDAEVLHARQRAAREVRHWRDDLGMVCGRFSLPPEVGVAFVNRLDAVTDRIRRAARRAGSIEPREAHAADAFAELLADGRHRAETIGSAAAAGAVVRATQSHLAGADGAGSAGGAGAVGGGRDAPSSSVERRTGGRDGAGGRPRRGGGRAVDLVVVCDLRAWRRGHAHSGEPCHILGGTPVPVRVARQLGGDAFLKAVVHDGKRIDTVVHWGRHIRAEVRTALELGRPPDFDGAVCVESGCGRRHGLEWDHVDPVADRGPTSYANLAARCWPHHHDKTDRDRAAGLLGPVRSGAPPARDGHDGRLRP